MDSQKIILEQYSLLFGKPTIKEIAKDTGIQLTRVFRLLNGSSMKLSEYLVFQKKVKEKMGLSYGLEVLAFECSQKLSPTAIMELESILKRKIEVWKISQKQESPNKLEQKMTLKMICLKN